MLYEHTTDISISRSAAVRYLIAAATKNTLQTTLQMLEKMATQSIELHRFIIMAAVSATWKTQLNEEKCTLASKLVTAALERSNALTLVSAAVDESPTPLTKESLTDLMTRDLKLSAQQQLQFAMGLLMNGAKGKEAATAFLNAFNVSQTMLKDDNGSTWALGLLARQAGDLGDLDAQLANACSGITMFPHNGSTDTHVNLSKIIGELGTACVATQADCRELLTFFPHPFTEKDVADVLGFFASQGSAPSDVNTYNALMSLTGKEPTRIQHGATISPIPLLELLQERSQGKIDWDNVLRLLDRPGEEPFKQKHVAIVFDAYHKFKGTGTPGAYPPVTIFLGRWGNVGRQRSAFEYILKHPEKVSLHSLPRDQKAPVELLEGTVAKVSVTASTTSASGVTRLAESEFWRFFPVVETAVHIASRDCTFDQETLCPAVKKHPLMFLYIFLFGTFAGTVKNFSLAKLILKEHWLSLDRVLTVILPEAEKRGRLDVVIMLLSELTIVDESRTIEVMEVVLQSKSAVKAFLAGGGNPRLVTAIAMCMDESAEPGDTWISKALEGKLHFRANAAENRFAVAMSIVEVAEQLLDKQKYVSNATAALNKFLSSSLKDVLRDVAEQARILLASSDSLFPSDIENEAMQFYKHMYSIGDPTNSASLDFIEQLLKSSNSRDKQLYACIVSIMFEERAAIGCYPPKELHLFAVLYGQMIARELLPPNQQQRAWNLLLPVIIKPADHTMEEYGIIVLGQIKPKLAEWPHYGRALRYVKDLDIKLPGIMAAINRGIKAEEASRQAQNRLLATEKTQPKEAESLLADPAVLAVSTDRREVAAAAAATPTASADRQKERSAAATLHQHDIGTLLSSNNITAPPRVIREQINFLIGNTDMHNIGNNAAELTKQLRPEYYEYFAEYLVVKRAALEPNYHGIYLDLLEKLQSKQLEKAIRGATVSSIQRLLKSDKIRTDPGERSLLKNLGSWLGLLTLAKNIPITVQELNFKELLFTGLREGKLMALVSCVTHVLHYCKGSHFFCPPNPWTMRLLCLLWEMYNLKHLRITLRFEVEVLCNHIGVSLKEIEEYYNMHPIRSSTHVHMVNVYNEINILQSEDFRVNEKELQESSGVFLQQAKQQPLQPQQVIQQQPQQAQQRPTRQLQASAEPFKPKESAPQANAVVGFDSSVLRRPPICITADTVRVSEEEEKYFGSLLPAYKSALFQMLSTITQEARPSMQRTATIAAVTAFNIVTKDFLFDPDVEAMMRAGDAMTRSLAANLCTVGIREVLLKLFEKHVSVLVDQFIDFNPPNAVERRNRLQKMVVENNMELCSHVLEYQAGEEAARMLREKLFPVAKERTDARNAGEPPRITKEQYEARDLLSQMGEVLRPTRSVPPLQRAAYEEFRYNFPIVEILAVRLRTIDDATTLYYSTENPKTLSLASSEFATGDFGDNHNVIRAGVVGISNMITRETAIYCVGYVLRKLVELAHFMKQIASMELSNKAGVMRQKNICTLRNEVYIFVLQTCLERAGEVVREELTRLFLQDEQRWHYGDLAIDLLRIKVLNISRLDEVLSKELQSGTTGGPVADFAGVLVQKTVIDEKFVSPKELGGTMAQFEMIVNQRRAQQQKHAQLTSQQQQQQQQHQHQQQRQAEVAAAPTALGAQATNTSEAYPPLSSLVGPDIRRLVLLSQLQHDPEEEEKVRRLFDEWMSINTQRTHRASSDTTSTSATATSETPSSSGNPPQFDFILTLRTKGQLDSNRLGTFLTLCIRFAVEHYATRSLELERANPTALKNALNAEWKPGNAPPHRYPYDAALFAKVDAFSDLATVLLYYCSFKNDTRYLLSLIRRILDALLRSIVDHHQCVVAQMQQQHHALVKGKLPPNTAYVPIFQQQPYVRFFSNLFTTLVRADSPNRDSTDNITHMFLDLLLRLSPMKYPAFAFGWLELVGHRIFFNRCLRCQGLWPHYVSLLIQGIEFIDYFARDGTISRNVLVFYKAFFKLMLVLTHDYSRFLITYHYQLSDVIPPYCAQLFNAVLCSIPTGVKLPEFYMRVPDDSPEMRRSFPTDNQVKCIEETFRQNNFDGNQLKERVRGEVPMDEAYMQRVVEQLQNVPHWRLMNAIVLHVCLVYLELHEALKPDFSDSNAMQFYRYLASTLDHRHRYHFICSCANHLRFPNVQTAFFVKVVLLLFLPHPSIPNAVTRLCIQEQITRVAVEKTLVIQPHPWGVLSTFMELMRAPEYGFWEKRFITGSSFLESMFHKLRRSVESRNAQQKSQKQTATVVAKKP